VGPNVVKSCCPAHTLPCSWPRPALCTHVTCMVMPGHHVAPRPPLPAPCRTHAVLPPAFALKRSLSSLSPTLFLFSCACGRHGWTRAIAPAIPTTSRLASTTGTSTAASASPCTPSLNLTRPEPRFCCHYSVAPLHAAAGQAVVAHARGRGCLCPACLSGRRVATIGAPPAGIERPLPYVHALHEPEKEWKRK